MARSQITPGTHGDVFSTPYVGEAGNRRPIPTADPCGTCESCLASGEGITVKCSSPIDRTKGKGKVIPTAWRSRTQLRLISGKLVDVERWDAVKTRAESAVRQGCVDRLAKEAAPAVARVGMTVGQAAAGWCETIRADSRDESLDDDAKLSAGTVTLYTGSIRRYLIGSDLAAMPLVEVTTEDVSDLLAGVARDHGVQTARSLRAALAGLWRKARKDRTVTSDPVRDAELPKGGRKVTSKLPLRDETGAVIRDAKGKAVTTQVKRSHDRAFSEPELVALTAACEASDDQTAADLILVMIETAVRIGEACGLLWTDVDLDAATADVVGTVSRVPGKGLVRGRTKTEGSTRTIPLSTRAVAILAARRPEDRGASPVFGSAAGTFLDPSNVQKRVRAILDPVGLSWATPHSFRRTAITRIADRVPLRLVADLAGHADPAMTAREYLGRKGDNSALRDAMNAL